MKPVLLIALLLAAFGQANAAQLFRAKAGGSEMACKDRAAVPELAFMTTHDQPTTHNLSRQAALMKSGGCQVLETGVTFPVVKKTVMTVPAGPQNLVEVYIHDSSNPRMPKGNVWMLESDIEPAPANLKAVASLRPAGAHISPAPYKTTTNMRFRTINYTNMVCTDARYAVRANLIASGFPVTTDPNYDAEWLQKQRDKKNCFQIAPNIAFHTTTAFAVYAGEIGAVWVTGVEDKGGNLIGYIPVTDIQFIPIPTL